MEWVPGPAILCCIDSVIDSNNYIIIANKEAEGMPLANKEAEVKPLANKEAEDKPQECTWNTIGENSIY